MVCSSAAAVVEVTPWSSHIRVDRRQGYYTTAQVSMEIAGSVVFPVPSAGRATASIPLIATTPSAANCGRSTLGLPFHVMFSSQVVLVIWLKIPPLVESLVTYRRSLAELIVAPAGRPATSKRMNACLALLP